jgi:LuxR family maltose regulon positive regulatory protein
VAPIASDDTASARSTDPPRTAVEVARSPVLDRLEGTTASVVVVHAPPGYGKTTSVAAWVQHQHRPVRWIELDRADNDPAELLAILVRALSEVTDFDPSGFSTVVGSHEQYSTTVAPRLARSIRRCHQPFVLVLDDAHVVQHQPSLDLIDAVVHHVPQHARVVIIGRAEPRLPLARLRVDSAIEEITSVDLALDVTEANELLAGFGLTLDDAEVGRLVSATEGWPVGLRLAAQALLADNGDIDELGERPLGHDHVVRDYVREEWLGGLDTDALAFLVQASWLDALSAPLCDVVLERSDSARMLDRLHSNDLLVIPLGRRGDEYLMHSLLRAVLLDESERSQRDHRRSVEQRASVWYESVGDVDRAIDFSLRARNVARAEQLAEQYGPDRLATGRVGTVQQWLDMFPRPQLLASSPLCLLAAAATVALGQADTTLTWLEFGRQAAESAGDTPAAQARSRIAALRSMAVATVDDDELDGAARAHGELAPGIWHAVACCGSGWLSAWTGDNERATRLLAEGAAEAQVTGAVTIEMQCRASLAVLWWTAGRHDQAAASARAARTLMREHELEELPTLVITTAMSALVEASDGDPATAHAEIALTRRNLVYVRNVGMWPNVQSRLALAQASLLLNDRVGARILADEAAALVAQAPATAGPRRQLAELLEQLERSREALPYGPSSLTTAELRVLHFLPTNLTLSDIAERLYVSRNTAKSHAAAVYRKLGVASRGEAVDLARAVGLLASDVADPVRS